MQGRVAAGYVPPVFMIKVVVSGAAGRMGRETMRAVWNADDMELVGAVDPFAGGADAGALIGEGESGIIVDTGLAGALERLKPDVMIDFTNPGSVFENTRTALERGVRTVVGTTGMDAGQLEEIGDTAVRCGVGCVVAPNFAIGAILMMKFAAEAARHFPGVEIIELHHDKKLDAPSGTAIKTAQLIARERNASGLGMVPGCDSADQSRGAMYESGIRIHSVRLPGMVANQEVIFGGLGQTLTIRHDTISRESFMPGVLLAVRRVMGITGLVYGLENIIFEENNL